MNAIDQYIAELSSCLHVGRQDRVRIVAEVRDHLDDAAEHRVRSGARREQAAIEAFGPASTIATHFNAEAGTRAMRRAPIVVFNAGAAVFVGLLVAGRAQPRPAVPMTALLATQVSFFVAVLAFQVAVAAGICAASRAIAWYRTPTARADDRQFVRRAATISTTALGIAAAAWVTTLGIAVDRLAHPNAAAALIGGAIMLGAATLAITWTRHLRFNPSDNSVAVYSDPPGIVAVGERAIAVVRRHPVVSCTVIAALSVWPAMAHAETTFTGALPWGIAQAAAVIIAFIVLGPALGLRQPQTD